MMMMIMIVIMIGYTCAVVDTIRKPSREKRPISMLQSVEVKLFVLSYRCGFMLVTILMMIMIVMLVNDDEYDYYNGDFYICSRSPMIM